MVTVWSKLSHHVKLHGSNKQAKTTDTQLSGNRSYASREGYNLVIYYLLIEK